MTIYFIADIMKNTRNIRRVAVLLGFESLPPITIVSVVLLVAMRYLIDKVNCKSQIKGEVPVINTRFKLFHILIVTCETVWATMVSDVASGCTGLS